MTDVIWVCEECKTFSDMPGGCCNFVPAIPFYSKSLFDAQARKLEKQLEELLEYINNHFETKK